MVFSIKHKPLFSIRKLECRKLGRGEGERGRGGEGERGREGEREGASQSCKLPTASKSEAIQTRTRNARVLRGSA
ncbi:MAG TPA: hypothetical protein DD379_21325 [Cyanobacteria bacterium UBA11162]|nr:hypothetical protein [Cyanobacteria bacterium UBA11162]